MPNPIDEFLEYEKTAGFMDLIRGVGRGVTSMGKVGPASLGGGRLGPVARRAAEAFQRGGELGQQMQGPMAMAAGGALATGIGVAAKKITQAITKRRDFRQMMELDPELAEARGKDPRFFNAAYSSMRNINPTFGGDPLTSGALMKKMLDNPANAGLILSGSVKDPAAPAPGGLGMDVSFGMGPATFSKKF